MVLLYFVRVLRNSADPRNDGRCIGQRKSSLVVSRYIYRNAFGRAGLFSLHCEAAPQHADRCGLSIFYLQPAAVLVVLADGLARSSSLVGKSILCLGKCFRCVCDNRFLERPDRHF